MELVFEVRLDLERAAGKPISQEDLEHATLEEIEMSLPFSIHVEDSTYDIVGSEVDKLTELVLGKKRQVEADPQELIRRAIRILKTRRIITTQDDFQKLAGTLWEEEVPPID